MATKAELEATYNRYRHACATAVQAEAGRDLRGAVNTAVVSLPLVHPAVTYRRRFLKADPAAPTLDLLLRYAPPLFLSAALAAVDTWYRAGTKTERAALPDVPDRLAAARHRLATAVELWSRLAAAPDARLAPDPACPASPEIVRTWLVEGAVVAVPGAGPPRYARTSDPRRVMHGKCSGCGSIVAVSQTHLLDPFPCAGCRRTGPFVLVRRLA